MRPEAAALWGLAVGASASPYHPGFRTRPRDNIPAICGSGAGHEDARKDTWSKTGGPFLDDFFKNNKVDNWANQFFIDQVNHGAQSISTHDCETLTSTDCGGIDDCQNYKDPAAFFVHQSMATLHDQLNYVSVNMKGQIFDDLGKTADTLADLYGPPEPKSNSFISYLIGGMITGAAAAGPAWFVASPLVAIAGFLNLVNGVVQDQKVLTPEQLSEDLKHDVTDVYDHWNSTLANSCDSAFGGDSRTLKDAVDDPAEWIKNLFADGKFLNKAWADSQTKTMWAGIQKRIDQGLVVLALKGGGYYVSRRTDWDQDFCKKMEKYNYRWIKDRCTAIGKDDKTQTPCDGGGCEEWTLKPLNDKQYKEFTGTYGFDFVEAIENAIECSASGGGDPPITTSLPKFGEEPPMPKCFVNLDVKQQDGSGNGNNVDNPDPAMINSDGYTPGACGIHYSYKEPDSDDYVWQIEATLKGAQGGPLTTATYQKLAPTAVIKGKESDKDAILPYDFYMAMDDVGDDTPVQFWYSNQYWTTSDDGTKVFPGCADHNCGFTCDPPSDNPPASATKDHPLPTALSYKPGWCTFHLKQVRKGGDTWQLDATVYDNDRNKVGTQNGVYIKRGDTASIAGPLPHDLKMTPEKETATFSYNGKEWKVNDDNGKASRNDGGHECGYGKWDTPEASDWTRSMDCGFWCD